MKYYSAWVTITGKVFVPEFEITDALHLKSDDESTAAEKLDAVAHERIEVAFHDLANDKIRELIRTDEPMKLYEIEIDSPFK